LSNINHDCNYTILGFNKKQFSKNSLKKKAKSLFCVVNDISMVWQNKTRQLLESSAASSDCERPHDHGQEHTVDDITTQSLAEMQNREGLHPDDTASVTILPIDTFIDTMQTNIRNGDCEGMSQHFHIW